MQSIFCEKFGKGGHFKRVCRSKKKGGHSQSMVEHETIERNDSCDEAFGISNDNEHHISSLSTEDIVYDNLKKRWVQKMLSDERVSKVQVMISMCTNSYATFKEQATGKPASPLACNKSYP